uniref:Uncharacterized protein n=1 Tax=Nomascus leucogenys TaxID=61853 RepID=A0A2I3GUN7_NOMLE
VLLCKIPFIYDIIQSPSFSLLSPYSPFQRQLCECQLQSYVFMVRTWTNS